MEIVSGCLIVKDNKILMVKEGKKRCYGQWSFPAGHVEKFEKITDAAIREVFEETGCKVELKGMLPICSVDLSDETIVMVRFVAEMVEENITFDKKEILDVKWIDIEKVKSMKEDELRGYNMSINFIKALEENKIYPIEIWDNTIYME